MNNADRIVSEVLDAEGQADDVIIRLSTGVELNAKQANPNVLIRIMTKTPRPDPPQVFMKAMGRYMENPDDPDYIARVKAWEMDYNAAMLNALIGLGTTLKSKPKSVPAPEDDDWIEDYKALGLPVVPESRNWRYITWVLFIAAPTDKDMRVIGEKIKNLSGVKEEAVHAAETFPASG